jgi:hypothetical protein
VKSASYEVSKQLTEYVICSRRSVMHKLLKLQMIGVNKCKPTAGNEDANPLLPTPNRCKGIANSVLDNDNFGVKQIIVRQTTVDR